MSPEPAVQRLRSRRQLVLGVVLTLSTFFFAAASFPSTAQRIVLHPKRALPAAAFKGLTQIVVEPSFEAKSVRLRINGADVATKNGAPFVFDVDLGAQTVERTLAVTAHSAGRTEEWSTTINRGQRPLSVTLTQRADGAIEAAITSSDDDPVLTVDFYDGDSRIASLSRPPWVVALERPVDVVVATARTRSGAESVATLAAGSSVHTLNYDVRTVPIFVSVTDQSGNSRVDLTQRDFRIFDKGREARVLEFGKAFDQPVSVALLLDASTSMTHEMRNASNAALRFVESLARPHDRFALFSVRSVPRRDVPLTTHVAELRTSLSKLSAGGETALYDTISAALRELKEQRGRRAIVVLSDGDDTASSRTYDEVLQEAKLAAIPVYFIIFSEAPIDQARGVDALKLLAADTGGFVAQADAKKLEERYRAIANDLRAQYAIKYEVADAAESGEWRPVKVVVSSPKLSARTIRGYFTP